MLPIDVSVRECHIVTVPLQTVVAAGTTYLIARSCVPSKAQLPWLDSQCDAFVLVLNPDLLTGKLVAEISKVLVSLNTDWIETFGTKAELLHDAIDAASVSIGRQIRIGDGDPMTSWHTDLATLNDIAEYLKLGGLGSSDFKIIIVLGSDQDASFVANRLVT